MWKTTLSTLAICGLCCAQPTPQPASQKAHVDGRVINLAGKPLSKATVALVGNNRAPGLPLPPVYTTISGPDGGYAFEGVEPNTYRLFVQRAGYMDFVFSQPDGKVVIEIAAGQQRTVEVKMTAQSFISGRITDEDGEPFPGARVSAIRITRVNLQKQLTALPAVPAGPDGSFTVGNLIAGRYYLSVSDSPSLTQTSQREVSTGQRGDERYVTTYYPNAIDTASATIIDVPAGSEIRNMDIRLQRARVFHIFGKAVDTSGKPVPDATLNLLYPGTSDLLGTANRGFAVDGAFEFNRLLPGTYAVQATSGASRELKARQTVTISDRDVNDLVVTLAPGAEIPLLVRIEGADPQQAEKIKGELRGFSLNLTDGVNTNATLSQPKGDGTWIFHNVAPATYRVGASGPDGTYVKSIRFGNQDITMRQLDTTSGTGPLEVVLSAHAADVSGVANGPNSQPLAGITVTLWTPGLPPEGTLDQAKSARTDAMGKFRFANLRPGEYRIAAWEKIDNGMGNLSEFHVQFDTRATVIKLSEDAHEAVQPVFISKDAIEAEAAKLQ